MRPQPSYQNPLDFYGKITNTNNNNALSPRPLAQIISEVSDPEILAATASGHKRLTRSQSKEFYAAKEPQKLESLPDAVNGPEEPQRLTKRKSSVSGFDQKVLRR